MLIIEIAIAVHPEIANVWHMQLHKSYRIIKFMHGTTVQFILNCFQRESYIDVFRLRFFVSLSKLYVAFMSMS